MTPSVQVFLLVLMRVSAFIFVSPGFSLKGVPPMMKIGLSVGLSTPVYSVMPVFSVAYSFPSFMVLAIKEVLIGLAIGYISLLFFSAAEMAGSFADAQAGFTMAALLDPSLGVNMSFLGKVYYWLALAIFFLGDLHHLMIQAIVQSFDQVPIVATVAVVQTEGIVKLFSMVFTAAFNLAAPLMIVALLTEILLGVLSRTVPQINVLILSMPLKVLVITIFMLAFLPVLMDNLSSFLPLMIKYTNEFIQSLSLG